MTKIPPISPIPTLPTEAVERAANAISQGYGEGQHRSPPTLQNLIDAQEAREYLRELRKRKARQK